MIFHLVVLLSLSWPHVTGIENKAPQDESAFDQIATASENVVQKAEKLQHSQKDFRDQLIPSLVDATIHYENSNGFVPMVVSSSSSPRDPYHQQTVTFSSRNNSTGRKDTSIERDNSTELIEHSKKDGNKETDKIEDDPVYSTEARIFLNLPQLSTNRRSFDFHERQNEFELLKVKNDTPAIANYPDFYEDEQNSMDNEQGKTVPSRNHKNKDRGKRIEDYVNNYGTDADQEQQVPYDGYYSYNTAKDKKKPAYQEKVTGSYHQQDATNYDGHGQSATRQNEPAASLPRTNQEVNEPRDTKNYNENYDNVAAPSYNSKTRHRFSRPVVVAEPSSYSNYKVDQTKTTNLNADDYQTSRVIDSASSEMSNRYTIYNRDGRFRSYEDSRDVSDDSMDYEYTERPRRVQKSRRRPYNTDGKRLPKEHRGSIEDSMEYESQGKRHNLSRSKSHRQRVKSHSWIHDDRKRGQDDSFEEARYEDRLTGSETKSGKTQSTKYKSGWSQISPNLEISHSSGIEIDQLEKPKFLVPIKVNLVPVANFDHATALDNSQGFDVSNAVLQNFVSATPASGVSTRNSPFTTSEPVQNVGVSNDPKHYQNLGVSTQASDIVVGQNTFHNSMHAVLPPSNVQNKYSNVRSQYVSSTVAPFFAVTPTLQNIQEGQGSVTPRTTYIATSSPSSNLQHVSANSILVPQPTIQTLSNFVHPNSEYNIQVNPHGLQGQNVLSHGDFQIHNIPAVTPTPQGLPVTKVNLITAESQNKKNVFSGSGGNFLASASLAVDHDQKQGTSANSYYVQNQGTHQVLKPQTQNSLYQVFKNVNLAPKTKTYIQTTHLLPAVLHPVPTLATIATNTQQLVPDHQQVQNTGYLLQQARDQNQQYMQQLQFQLQRDQLLKNSRLPSLTYQTIDNVGSHTNNANSFNGLTGIAETAHLPNVGMKNVEILNPNIKPSPIDTTLVNSYETMHYPTAVLTTPIPMFSTTSFVTARPALVSTTTTEGLGLQNYVDSLTEIGSKNNQQLTDLKTYQTQERPMFNPINFVPNVDVVKSQNALNNKLHASEPLQQNLNLVPLIPGGNFFKPSYSAQSELMSKPKLTSDLEKYAEQMFKESLKTIYNSQKWNNDRKPHTPRQNMSDTVDLAKLRNELQRLKASLDSKRNKDPFEAMHSENKVRATDIHGKKPDELLAALEQMLKNQGSDPLHGHHGNGRPNRNRRPGDPVKSSFGSSDFRDMKHIRDFLTPPKLNSHRSKGSFHEKGKKRPSPGPPRFNGQSHFGGPRSHPRPNSVSKSGNLETSATNVEPIRDGSRYETFRQIHSDFQGSSFDSYPSLTTPLPDTSALSQLSKIQKTLGKDFDINHPRMHNLLGLLMKNKRLPPGNSQNYFRDKDQLKQFFEDEKRRLHQQFYDDTLRDYFLKSADGNSYSDLRSDMTGGRRSFADKSTVSS